MSWQYHGPKQVQWIERVPFLRSYRLSLLASWVEHQANVVDIACDHGLLALALLQQNSARRVIASDIGKTPLSVARKNAEERGFSALLECRQGDGFQTLQENEADTAIVAGISGEKIAFLLSRDRPQRLGVRTLLLQPNMRVYEARKALTEEGWDIEEEVFFLEGKRFFLAIKATFPEKQEPLTEKECFLGRAWIGSKDPFYLQWLHDRRRWLLEKNGGTCAETNPRLKWIDEELCEN